MRSLARLLVLLLVLLCCVGPSRAQETGSVAGTAGLAVCDVGAPALVSPPAGETFPSGSPITLDWNAARNATEYRLELDDDPAFGSPSELYVGSATEHTIPGRALDPGRYSWRVRGCKIGLGACCGSYSDSRSFAVCALPAAPALLSPADDALTTFMTMLFGWGAVSGADEYELRLTNTATQEVITVNTATAYYQRSEPLQVGLYDWKLRARDHCGWGIWSAVRSFWACLPAAPTITGPIAGDTFHSDQTVQLFWKDMSDEGAASYQIEVDTHADFSAPIVQLTRLAPSAGAGPFPPGDYYWRVRALSSHCTGESGPWASASFRVCDGLGAPQLLLPWETPEPTVGLHLYWTAVAGAVDYEVQITRWPEDLPRFEEVLVYHTAQTNLVITDKLELGCLFWRVRARNAACGNGPWSFIDRYLCISFVQAPRPLRPADGAVIPAGQAINFSWVLARDPDGDYYPDVAIRFLVDDDPTFGSPEVSLDIAPTLQDPHPEQHTINAGALAPGRYYWKVAEGTPVQGCLQCDGPVCWSPYSAVWSLVICDGAPGVPQLLRPPEGSTQPTRGIYFSWYPLPEATGYQLQVYDADASTEVYSATLRTYWHLLRGPLPQGNYAWRARASNDCGIGDWSPLGHFRVCGLEPPQFISPLPGAFLPSGQPITLAWSAQPATSYHLQVDANSSFALPIVDVLLQPYPPGGDPPTSYQIAAGALAPGIFYWRVAANTDECPGSWGRASYFSVIEGMQPPYRGDGVRLLAPANGAALPAGASLTLDWRDSAQAVGYRVEAAPNSAFSDLVIAADASVSQHTLPSGLPEGAYWWRARVQTADGDGPWSAVWGFTVGQMIAPAPDGPPLLRSPADGALQPRSNVTLAWMEAAFAAGYRVQIAADGDFQTIERDVAVAGTELWIGATNGASGAERLARAEAPLPTGEHWWRVCAQNGSGDGPWSLPWSVRVFADVSTVYLSNIALKR